MKPRMLQLLRESRGLSQAELAELSELPVPFLARVELGLDQLEAAQVHAVTEVLDYPHDVFGWPDEIFGFGSAAFHHRKQHALDDTTLKRIQAEVNLLRMRSNRLLRGVDPNPRFRFPSHTLDELGTPEQVARAVRAAWKLPMGPVWSMVRALEGAGALIVRADLYSPRIAAISTSVPDAPPLFVLNQGLPADRERFTLAHELGHLVMHDEPSSPPDAEREADGFAAELLMPAAEIAPQLRDLDLARAAQLKQQWKVSMAALVDRAHGLGEIEDAQYESLVEQLTARGWRRTEPVELEHEHPTLLRHVIWLHHTREGLDVADLAAMTGLHVEEYVERFDDSAGGQLSVVR